jgi:hypothetical protein
MSIFTFAIEVVHLYAMMAFSIKNEDAALFQTGIIKLNMHITIT